MSYKDFESHQGRKKSGRSKELRIEGEEMRLKKLLVVRSQRRKKCGPWLPEDFHKTDNSPGLGGLKPWNESFDTVQS